MNSDELVAQVRRNTTTEDSDTDYTAAVLLNELSDSLTTKFQQMIVDTNAGYWVQQEFYTTTTQRASYRMPVRAIGLSKVEIASGVGEQYYRLAETSEGHADVWECSVSNLGTPAHWVARGDQIVLLPTPDNSAYSLRVTYYVRPSRLWPSQNAVSGTDRGRITSITNIGTRQVTVNALPFDMSLVTPVAITTAVQSVDIVHPNGWHELSCVSATQTIAALVLTLGGTQDLSRVQVGDYVRVSDQTDWPPLPVDYHRCLADVTSIKVLVQQDYQQKASAFSSDVTGDLQRFSSLINRRVQEESRRVRAKLPSLRRGW